MEAFKKGNTPGREERCMNDDELCRSVPELSLSLNSDSDDTRNSTLDLIKEFVEDVCAVSPNLSQVSVSGW